MASNDQRRLEQHQAAIGGVFVAASVMLFITTMWSWIQVFLHGAQRTLFHADWLPVWERIIDVFGSFAWVVRIYVTEATVAAGLSVVAAAIGAGFIVRARWLS